MPIAVTMTSGAVPSDPRQCVHRGKGDLTLKPDGSVDLYFGPEAPEGIENNWVQTVPGKGWLATLRLYGPLATLCPPKWGISNCQAHSDRHIWCA
jgi:hypothetical protein